MNQEQLRNELKRLSFCENINDSKELLGIYLEFLFKVIQNTKNIHITTLADNEATVINQMIFTKAAHLKQSIEGMEFVAVDGSRLNKIIDPTIIASLIRNLYETVAMFNLIYINTKSADEKLVLYNLWVHAGLKYRQKFESAARGEDSKQKLQDERKNMLRLVEEIENTELYKSLDEPDKIKIKRKLKEKDFKIQFIDNNVEFLNWEDLIKPMGIKENIMGSMYTFFSLYSHPSNVAVFQFKDMFQINNPKFLELTNFNTRNLFFLLSIFIADYIKLFPDILKVFNSMDLKDQIIINYHNVLARSDNFSINNCLLKLG